MPNDVDASARLWAITSYYNPASYRRRLENYRIFRERLALPLLTVELAYGEPELGPGDADILVQIPGTDVMWQKERLLNVAVARLPATCDRVVWLDCDVVFPDPDWPARLDRMLDAFALVQPFTRAHYLGRDWEPGVPTEPAIERTRIGMAQALADGRALADAFEVRTTGRMSQPAKGLAWAARRALLERHGIYDTAICGGGDRLLVAAAFGWSEVAADQQRMGDHRRAHYLDWAGPWSAAIAGSVAALDADVLNQWHGEMQHRGDAVRHYGLAAFDFDPAADLALDPAGAWRWASDKPDMHAYVRDYFASRREDG